MFKLLLECSNYPYLRIIALTAKKGKQMLSTIQLRLLEMLKWFHNYCSDNELTYYIIGGSMLGAIRHEGFIPWDDDIDVALPRPDYEKLIKTFDNVGNKYVLESPYDGNNDYYYSYAKLYDTNSVLVEKARHKCVRGVYIDVFPLDGIGNTYGEGIKNFKRVDRRNMFLMTRTCAITRRRGLVKNISIVISRFIPQAIVNDHKLILKIDKIASSFGYDECKYVANLMGTYREKEIFDKTIFGEPAEYKFENIRVNGVEKYEEYLTHLYGDWRRLPPLEKQKTAHEFLELDLEKSWLN